MHAKELIADYRPYTQHFNRTEYPEFFRCYQEAAQPFFRDLSPQDVAGEVKELLDELEKNWALHRWKFRREAVREDDKLLLLLYLAPAAVEFASEPAQAFAHELARQWNERYPDSPFRVGTFAQLQDGFRWKPKWKDFF